eukprot:m.319927 g.319927  ORF g.319927 m.319927 type:complete len:311 (+) comp23582_c0_seq1:1151-2083(+)
MRVLVVFLLAFAAGALAATVCPDIPQCTCAKRRYYYNSDDCLVCDCGGQATPKPEVDKKIKTLNKECVNVEFTTEKGFYFRPATAEDKERLGDDFEKYTSVLKPRLCDGKTCHRVRPCEGRPFATCLLFSKCLKKAPECIAITPIYCNGLDRTTDNNDDGIPDLDQKIAKTAETSYGNGAVAVSAGDEEKNPKIIVKKVEEVAAPNGLDAPLGGLDFRVKKLAEEGNSFTATVVFNPTNSMDVDCSTPKDVYALVDDVLIDITDDVTFEAGNFCKFSIELTDNGSLDDKPAKNKTFESTLFLVEPSGSGM